MSVEKPNPDSNQQKISFSLDLRIITALLLAIIAIMLLLWQPWSRAGQGDRTVNVTGQATLKAEPDEYVFSPSYKAKNEDKTAALAELTQKSETVIAQLKKLGVADNKIKTSSNGYSNDNGRSVEPSPIAEGTTYTLNLTVTVNNRQQAQKIQDYMVTTAPEGAVSPQANFSDAKRKQLENQARDEATKDARAKAEQSARNLGFKVGHVKQVADAAGFGVIPMDVTTSSDAAKTMQQLSVQPGQNDLTYSVNVIFYVK